MLWSTYLRAPSFAPYSIRSHTLVIYCNVATVSDAAEKKGVAGADLVCGLWWRREDDRYHGRVLGVDLLSGAAEPWRRRTTAATRSSGRWFWRSIMALERLVCLRGRGDQSIGSTISSFGLDLVLCFPAPVLLPRIDAYCQVLGNIAEYCRVTRKYCRVLPSDSKVLPSYSKIFPSNLAILPSIAEKTRKHGIPGTCRRVEIRISAIHVVSMVWWSHNLSS